MKEDPLKRYLTSRTDEDFERLIAETERYLLRAAHDFTDDENLTDFVVRGVYIRIMRKPPSPEKIQNGWKFLKTAVINDMIRTGQREDWRKGREQKVEAEKATRCDASPEAIEEVRFFMARMPDSLRPFAELRFCLDKTVREIATEMSVSPGTAGARVNAALRWLQARLSDRASALILPVLEGTHRAIWPRTPDGEPDFSRRPRLERARRAFLPQEIAIAVAASIVFASLLILVGWRISRKPIEVVEAPPAEGVEVAMAKPEEPRPVGLPERAPPRREANPAPAPEPRPIVQEAPPAVEPEPEPEPPVEVAEAEPPTHELVVTALDPDGQLLRHGNARIEPALTSFQELERRLADQPEEAEAWKDFARHSFDLAEGNPFKIADIPEAFLGIEFVATVEAEGFAPKRALFKIDEATGEIVPGGGDDRDDEEDDDSDANRGVARSGESNEPLVHRLTVEVGRVLHLAVEVLDARTKKPIVGATVESRTPMEGSLLEVVSGVAGGDVVEAETDEKGVAILRELSEGLQTVKVNARGYTTKRIEDVNPAETPALSVRLQKASGRGALEVVVTGPAGGFLADLEVTLHVHPDGARRLKTDSDGRVVFDDVPPGHHFINLISGRWFQLSREWMRSGAEAASSRYRSDSRPVDIAKGERKNIAMGFVAGTASILGAVIGTDGSPRKGLQVKLIMPCRAERKVDTFGRVILDGLPAGSYRFDIAGWSMPAVKVGAGEIVKPTWVLGDAAVHGQAVDAKGKALGNADITLTLVRPHRKLITSLKGRSLLSLLDDELYATVEADDKGRFRFENVPPGRCRLTVDEAFTGIGERVIDVQPGGGDVEVRLRGKPNR